MNHVLKKHDNQLFVRVKPCRPRTTAYTVGGLVQDRQYICDSPSTTAFTVGLFSQCRQSIRLAPP